MRHITNAKARQQGRRELRAVFKALRLKDGLTVDVEERVEPDDFIYWYNKARNGDVGNYIVYETIASDPLKRADDAVIAREFYAQVDVFSTRSFESKQLTDTLARLEEKLTEAGFEVEAREEDYEPDTRLYHQALFVSKMYS